jgi:hypothetical protein
MHGVVPIAEVIQQAEHGVSRQGCCACAVVNNWAGKDVILLVFQPQTTQDFEGASRNGTGWRRHCFIFTGGTRHNRS